MNSGVFFVFVFVFKDFYLFIRGERGQAETQAEGEAGSMHREPDVGFDPGSAGSRPGPKAGAKPLRHPGIPDFCTLIRVIQLYSRIFLSDMTWDDF